MIDLKLNSKRLGLHWHYYWFRYTVFLVAAMASANLLFSATRPQIPYDQKVDIFLYSGAASDETISVWERELLRMLPPDQKEVSILSTPVIQGQEAAIQQIVMARMAAREGTIWILPKSDTIDFFTGPAASEAFMPLDNILPQLNLPKDMDLSAGTVAVQPDKNLPAVSQKYGIPLDRFKGLSGLFIPDGMVLALPGYADANLPNVISTVNWLLSKTEEPQAVPPGEDRFEVVIASYYFASTDTTAWQKEQQGKFSPEMGLTLMPYHIGREDMVARDLIAGRAGKPGLCIVPREVFVAMARRGALTPLDGAESLFKFPGGTDLSAGRETAAAKGKEPATEHLYGIPLDKCAGLTQVFNPQGMMAVFPTQPGEALSSAIDVANWFLSKTEIGK